MKFEAHNYYLSTIINDLSIFSIAFLLPVLNSPEYSLYTLCDVVPTRDLDCWSLFVRASVLLRQYTISMKDIDGADEKLLEFCKIFEDLYGKEYCNLNVHLHAHVF